MRASGRISRRGDSLVACRMGQGYPPSAARRLRAKVTMKKNYVLDTNVMIHDPHAFL